MRNEEVVVSVIVLTFNHKQFIQQALDSILNQTVSFRYEILIGDDGSSDGTRAILLQYADRYPNRIRLFLREENLGAARNAYELLMESRGKYLAFCEGDDYWIDPEKLQRQVQFLEENPQFIGCTHRCEIVDEFGQKRKNQALHWVREKDCFTLRDFQGIYLPGQTATVVKHNLFRGKERPYSFLYEANRNISDRTSTLLYLTKGPFGFLPEVMSAYRQVEKAGLTNHVYEDNPYRILHELEYTLQLEEIAKSLTDQKGIFHGYYQQLYAWAVWQYLKHPSASNFEIVKSAAKCVGKGLIHPYAFVVGLLKKTGKIQ